MKKLLRRLLRILLGLLAPVVLYLLLWPTDVEPVAWEPPTPPALENKYNPDPHLAQAVVFGGDTAAVKLLGPEDIVRDSAGWYYTGCVTGDIYRFKVGGQDMQLWAHINGRPLGMAFDTTGHLIVAGGDGGLLRLSPDGKTATVLTTGLPDSRAMVVNDVALSDSGLIYFTDASRKFGLGRLVADVLEHRPNGRVMVYDPAKRETRLVLDSLYYANGLVLSPDEDYLLVNETWMYRVRRIWLKGPKAGTTDVFADNLPGFPDNIDHNGKGSYWVALVSPRSKLVDGLAQYPFVRKIFSRLPDVPRPVPNGMALRLNSEGDVTGFFMDNTLKVPSIASINEIDGFLWLGSPYRTGMGRVPAP